MNEPPTDSASDSIDNDPLLLLEKTKAEEEALKQAAGGTSAEPADSQPTALSNGKSEAYNGSESQGDDSNGDELDTDYADNNEWKPLLEYRLQAIRVRNKQQNMELRDRIASVSIALVCIQIFVANVFFLIYLLTNLNDTNPNVMIAWLSASVVEVIGIMLVVARSLFKPDRNNKSANSNNDQTS